MLNSGQLKWIMIDWLNKIKRWNMSYYQNTKYEWIMSGIDFFEFDKFSFISSVEKKMVESDFDIVIWKHDVVFEDVDDHDFRFDKCKMLSNTITGTSRIGDETIMILNDILVHESFRIKGVYVLAECWELLLIILNSQIRDESTFWDG